MNENRSNCEWSDTQCDQPRWAPYSWHYCAWHFAWNAISIDQERKLQELPPVALSWVRERFCGVLNGYTPQLGDVNWRSEVPREKLAILATEVINLSLDEIKEVQWREAQAVAAEQYPHKWARYDRTVPLDYDGPGARIVAKTNRESRGIGSDFEGSDIGTGGF